MKINKLINSIFSISNGDEFFNLALDIFKFQAANNLVYKQYIEYLKIDYKKIDKLSDIPFLPIEFFKTKKVVSSKSDTFDKIFISSGTTGVQQSKHYIVDIEIYKRSFIKTFEMFYGNPENYSILALLPSYLEREGSSLVYMVDFLINMSKKKSGFYLNNLNELIDQLKFNEHNNIKTILFGVTFALLDLSEKYNLKLRNTIIIETGGMKGRHKEITKDELYTNLRDSFGDNEIHSEYGMTELLSQSYSLGSNIFKTPEFMKIMIRDIYDPFHYLENKQSGGINIIDLSNIYSCSFIETKDIGRKFENGDFEVLGRFDNSEIRGCNLLVVNN